MVFTFDFYRLDVNLCLLYTVNLYLTYKRQMKLDVNIDHLITKMSPCIFYICCLHVRRKFSDIVSCFCVSEYYFYLHPDFS